MMVTLDDEWMVIYRYIKVLKIHLNVRKRNINNISPVKLLRLLKVKFGPGGTGTVSMWWNEEPTTS